MGHYSQVTFNVDSAPYKTQHSRFRACSCFSMTPPPHPGRYQSSSLGSSECHQEEHLVRSVRTGWCLPALPEMCQSRGSLPCSQPASRYFPAFFIRICLLLWLCLGSELWVRLTVDTGTVSAACTLGWGGRMEALPQAWLSWSIWEGQSRAKVVISNSCCGIWVAVLLC